MKPSPTISLETILDEPLRFDFELPFAVEELGGEPIVSISPVRLAGEVSKVEGGHAVNARISWAGELECSRCLAAYDFASEEDFSVLLYPRRPITEKELSLEPEDLDAHFYDDPVLEVAPIAAERIQIALPMKPLCSEACRGLCPRCGADRNISECACDADPAVVETVDPRWRALAALKKE